MCLRHLQYGLLKKCNILVLVAHDLEKGRIQMLVWLLLVLVRLQRLLLLGGAGLLRLTKLISLAVHLFTGESGETGILGGFCTKTLQFGGETGGLGSVIGTLGRGSSGCLCSSRGVGRVLLCSGLLRIDWGGVSVNGGTLRTP